MTWTSIRGMWESLWDLIWLSRKQSEKGRTDRQTDAKPFDDAYNMCLESRLDIQHPSSQIRWWKIKWNIFQTLCCKRATQFTHLLTASEQVWPTAPWNIVSASVNQCSIFTFACLACIERFLSVTFQSDLQIMFLLQQRSLELTANVFLLFRVSTFRDLSNYFNESTDCLSH